MNYITLSQLASLSGKSYQTVRDHREQGKIKAEYIKYGKRKQWLIDSEEVSRYIATEHTRERKKIFVLCMNISCAINDVLGQERCERITELQNERLQERLEDILKKEFDE